MTTTYRLPGLGVGRFKMESLASSSMSRIHIDMVAKSYSC